jgi:hypothetical protein
LSTNDEECAVKNAKYQMVFFLTCIALLWFEHAEPPKATAHHVAWQAAAPGG